MSARLDGRVILVTGAATGIGREIVRRSATEGARVACVDIELEGAQAAAREIGVDGLGIAADVADDDSARAAIARTVEAFGGLHGLVNSAAAPSVAGTVGELDPADWSRELAVSLTGAFLMSKYAVPEIARTGGGSIVHVASQLAHVAVAGGASYCVAKAGLVQLARVMALDHAGQGIRVNSLSPGAVATERLTRAHGSLDLARTALAPKHPIGRIAEPEEIASAAIFLLSDESSFMTGADLLVDGGYCAW
jgi:NAD(P)-dependent dehydrogenase (short-subunit alcohol dehydrogenase family)